ncbi:MAG: DUF3624 family protein [Alphaproteobacteria bacterium]|nr:DUF3624 family protein [Alphaproteobacteria bacterium]
MNMTYVTLGRCPKCMRQSFIFMMGAWAVALVTPSVTDLPAPAIAAAALASAATVLWLAHITAFALGAAGSADKSGNTALERNISAGLVSQQRRQFISSFAKVFVLGAAATALPAGSVFAQSHLNDCLTCCASKLKACGSDGKCNTLYQNCVSSCNSQGETPSGWNCW